VRLHAERLPVTSIRKATIMRIAIIALLAACGVHDPKPAGDDGTDPNVLPNLMVPPTPDNGIQVITPIYRGMGPSSDTEVCTWTDAIFDQTTDVRASQAFQSEPGGHHVIIYYTTVKQTPGTQRICKDEDMATFRMLTGSGEGIVNQAPGDLVFRIPAGAQLVINHHYLNTTDQTIDGQAAVNLMFAEPGIKYTPSGNVAIVDTSLDVTPGMYSTSIHCVFDRDFKLWYLIPHMHQWGANQKVELTLGGVKQTVFDTKWDPSFTFHPPEMRVDPNTPMVVHAGDTIDTTCTYNNDTGHDLTFGFEMCVVFGQFVDDQSKGGRACDQGHWLGF
jgi:hypothetical protein